MSKMYKKCANKDCNTWEVYWIGAKIWNEKTSKLNKISKENFENCINCGHVLTEALGICGCIKNHSRACLTYSGPD